LGCGVDDEDLEADDPLKNACATFNLNFFRPHVFALEAIPEISEFVDAFELEVSEGDSIPKQFSPQHFQDQWSVGNACAYKGLRNEAAPKLLPAIEIERVWRWNMARGDYQERIGESLFVPKLFYFGWQESLVTGVVWPDGIPMALPPCDIVWIMRKEIAARSFFGIAKKRSTYAIVRYSEVTGLPAPFRRTDTPFPHLLLQYDRPPKVIIEYLNRFPASETKPEAIPTDHVLNREIWDANGTADTAP
jgi:hypothetical protein